MQFLQWLMRSILMRRFLRVGSLIFLFSIIIVLGIVFLEMRARENRRARASSLQMVVRSLKGRPLSEVIATLGSPTRIEVTRASAITEQHSSEQDVGQDSTLKLLYEYD